MPTYTTSQHYFAYFRLWGNTVSWIFVPLAVFLETLIFNQLNIKPRVIYQNGSQAFCKKRHGITDIVNNWTEFKFEHATHLDFNSFILSNYKYTITHKALILILPHGKRILYSDLFPGSISDSV